MRKFLSAGILAGCIGLLVPSPAEAQVGLLAFAQTAATKVIKAIDLRIQRLQNQTIALQEAQKELENALSKLKLQEIADWVQRQRDLYADYFDELSRVKSVLTEYHRVRELMAKQAAISGDYQQAMGLFRQDGHFTAAELQHMGEVYEGILQESLRYLSQVGSVLTGLTTKMTDEQRMQLINEAADGVDRNYSDLEAFTHQNQVLSMQRAKNEEEVNQVRKLYGW